MNFADQVTNLNLVRERFSFIIIMESRLTDESNLVSEVDGDRFQTINRVCRTREVLNSSNWTIFQLNL